jgi:hypothetical protein
MKVLTNIKNHRIEAANVLIELTMEGYLSIALCSRKRPRLWPIAR